MFERLVDAPVFLAMVDPKRRNSWQMEPARQIVVKLLKDGYSIVVHSGPYDQNHILLAEGYTVEEVRAGIRHAILRANAKMVEESNDSAAVRN